MIKKTIKLAILLSAITLQLKGMVYHIFYRSQSKSIVAATEILQSNGTVLDIFVEKFLCADSETYSVTSRICNSDLGISGIGDIETDRDLSAYEDIILQLKERITDWEHHLENGFTYDL